MGSKGKKADQDEETRSKGATKGGASDGGASASGTSSGAGQPLIDLDFVRGLIEAVDNSGIDSLEVTRAGTRVKIAKTPPTAGPAPSLYAAQPPMQMPAAPGPAPSAPAAEAGGATSGAGAGAGGAPAGGAAAGGAAADAGAAAGAPAESAEPASGLVEIESPMVGTFYRAPAPEAPAYVEVGTRVSKGQTLCILEAMKLMNELESEVDGVVREILVDNAEPVEYGQVLFRIDPNG